MRLAIKTATLCMAMACPFAGWSQAVAVGATGSTVNTGIAPQASEPTIGPQFNQPMVGQPGPAPAQPGFPQPAEVLPPGVLPGLSDQGLIFPAPGTIAVGPQGNTAVIASQNAAIGVGSVTGVGVQGQDTVQDQRGIGIAHQASEPTIGPQFNQPMIGQPGPSPAQFGFPQPAQVLPAGVQPGLSDQGLIFPAQGTIIVGPQVASQSGTGSGSSIGAGAQGQDPTMAPNNIAPVMNPGAYQPALGSRSAPAASSFQPALPTNVPQSGAIQPQGVSPVLTPTGRSDAGTATGTGASGGK